MAKTDKNAKSNQVVQRVEGKAREEALEKALEAINKRYGVGSLMKLGDKSKVPCEVISTGIPNFDLALGVGGFPKGRIIELYGPESSGKTTIALYTIAQVQKEGGTAAFIDAEHALDPIYAAKLGVNLDDLLVSQPDTGEDGLEITEALVRSGTVDLIVVDSVAALVPRNEIDGNMGDAQMGLHARLMSQALRKLTGAIAKSKAVVIFLNQLREKMGVSGPAMNYPGANETTTGGRALRFYASVRAEIRRGDTVKSGSENIGYTLKMSIKKNKMAPPFRKAEVKFIYGVGVDKEDALMQALQVTPIFTKAGSWYSYKGEKVGQGFEKVKTRLAEDPDFRARVLADFDEILKNPQSLIAEELKEAQAIGQKASGKKSKLSEENYEDILGLVDDQEDEIDVDAIFDASLDEM